MVLLIVGFLDGDFGVVFRLKEYRFLLMTFCLFLILEWQKITIMCGYDTNSSSREKTAQNQDKIDEEEDSM